MLVANTFDKVLLSRALNKGGGGVFTVFSIIVFAELMNANLGVLADAQTVKPMPVTLPSDVHVI